MQLFKKNPITACKPHHKNVPWFLPVCEFKEIEIYASVSIEITAHEISLIRFRNVRESQRKALCWSHSETQQIIKHFLAAELYLISCGLTAGFIRALSDFVPGRKRGANFLK